MIVARADKLDKDMNRRTMNRFINYTTTGVPRTSSFNIYIQPPLVG